MMKSTLLLFATLCLTAVFSACQSNTADADPGASEAEANEPATGGEGEVAQGGEAPAVDNATHTITTEIREENGARVLVATVAPGTGYHVNLEFPWALQMAEDSPVAAGTRMTGDQAARFEEAGVEFTIPVDDAAAAGECGAQLRMSVCDDAGTTCLTPREALTWTLAAAE